MGDWALQARQCRWMGRWALQGWRSWSMGLRIGSCPRRCRSMASWVLQGVRCRSMGGSVLRGERCRSTVGLVLRARRSWSRGLHTGSCPRRLWSKGLRIGSFRLRRRFRRSPTALSYWWGARRRRSSSDFHRRRSFLLVRVGDTWTCPARFLLLLVGAVWATRRPANSAVLAMGDSCSVGLHLRPTFRPREGCRPRRDCSSCSCGVLLLLLLSRKLKVKKKIEALKVNCRDPKSSSVIMLAVQRKACAVGMMRGHFGMKRVSGNSRMF